MDALRATLRTDVRVHSLAPGALPVAEHKTTHVFRTARGDVLPAAIAAHRESTTDDDRRDRLDRDH